MADGLSATVADSALDDIVGTLDQRAKDALSTVRSAMAGEGVGQMELVPLWHFPPPLRPGLTRVRFIDGEGWTWDALRDN
jgi:hypothetical protein